MLKRTNKLKIFFYDAKSDSLTFKIKYILGIKQHVFQAILYIWLVALSDVFLKL